MSNKKHMLKINQIYADDVYLGKKTFEIRLNDRDYKVGDLIEFTVVSDTGKIIKHPIFNDKYVITYIIDDFHIDDRYVVFSIKLISRGGSYV